jgi:hypothetical protein
MCVAAPHVSRLRTDVRAQYGAWALYTLGCVGVALLGVDSATYAWVLAYLALGIAGGILVIYEGAHLDAYLALLRPDARADFPLLASVPPAEQSNGGAYVCVLNLAGQLVATGVLNTAMLSYMTPRLPATFLERLGPGHEASALCGRRHRPPAVRRSVSGARSI